MVAYVVKGARFRALRARAREAGFFFHGSIFFAETVPTRYRMSMGGHNGRQILVRFLLSF